MQSWTRGAGVPQPGRLARSRRLGGARAPRLDWVSVGGPAREGGGDAGAVGGEAEQEMADGGNDHQQEAGTGEAGHVRPRGGLRVAAPGDTVSSVIVVGALHDSESIPGMSDDEYLHGEEPCGAAAAAAPAAVATGELHEECTGQPGGFDPRCRSGHRLAMVFVEPDEEYLCDGCEAGVDKGIVYYCGLCDFCFCSTCRSADIWRRMEQGADHG